ncbi:hypothetical protein WICPIJ_000321 [Wickerhamomyces pijperi]|uniref:DNA replication licensing factor MCM2 n=1 Tax=Wickerhamomyces pijperi TaxID=599730 RepID=A0A9P8QE59_WICPI|nr:hypothetical protein WICPIJ_000321 [Wickerhamomyces pijperi]
MSSRGNHNSRKRPTFESDSYSDDDGVPGRRSLPNSSPQLIPPSSPIIPYEDAVEDRIQDDDFDALERAEDDLEEEDGIDLMDQMENDYRFNATEDTYDLEDGNIDDTEIQDDGLGLAGYRRVTKALEQRDQMIDNVGHIARREGRGGFRMRGIRRGGEDDEDFDSEEVDPLEQEVTSNDLLNITTGTVLEWVLQPNVRNKIQSEFRSFLSEYTDDNGTSVYGSRIKALGRENKQSLEVDFPHLRESKAQVAILLGICPEKVLEYFNTVAREAVMEYYADYNEIHNNIYVRVISFDTAKTLRQLRESDLNTFVTVSGVVTRRGGVFPQLSVIYFDCIVCGKTAPPVYQEGNEEIKPFYCPNCKKRSQFTINSVDTTYRNYQRLTLQESPGTVSAGRLPRHREVILLNDLVDITKPGEEVEITGIYKQAYNGSLNAKNGFPTFMTVIEANSVKKNHGDNSAAYSWTPEEEADFKKMSRDGKIIDDIINSIAPSIYGHREIKTAIACSLFGGVGKNINGKHSIRGDINVLLLGDPGTAKSQILKYVEKTAQRAVFATGQGASAVGLTATVRKDAITKEWTLEGGALVLADKGVCLIDEFDKMNDQDRTSIHEAMEQQSISISKAGIITTLQARCAIIAAANPNGGKYNANLTLPQNVDLTEPILSRFDILCVVRDKSNKEIDAKLAKFVINSHIRSTLTIDDQEEDEDELSVPLTQREKNQQLKTQKESEISPIPQEKLTKYIHYARSHITPKLSHLEEDKISRVYADLRHQSKATGSFPITVRHFESILRTAESFAKMRLAEYVSNSDVDRAIEVAVKSFIGVQKQGVKKELERGFWKYTQKRKQRGMQQE